MGKQQNFPVIDFLSRYGKKKTRNTFEEKATFCINVVAGGSRKNERERKRKKKERERQKEKERERESRTKLSQLVVCALKRRRRLYYIAVRSNNGTGSL